MRARERVEIAAWPAAMRFATAARYLDCSETELRSLVNSGRIPAIQFDARGHRRVRREAMDEFLREREDAPVVA